MNNTMHVVLYENALQEEVGFEEALHWHCYHAHCKFYTDVLNLIISQ